MRGSSSSDMNIPERLYHYTTREKALEHILPSKRIWLNSLGRTNDPRETEPWNMSMGGAPGDPNPLSDGDMSQAAEAYNRIRLNEWLVLCLSRDHPDLSDDPSKQYLANFQRGYARARMWAHYAENHRGICLEFHGPSLHEAIIGAAGGSSSVFHGTVTYGDELNMHRIAALGEAAFHLYHPNLSGFASIEEGVRAHILRHYRRWFLEKSADWGSEIEFRWLVHRAAAHQLEVDITKTLRTVIVSVDFPTVYEPSVRQLCNQLGIGLDRMVWQNRVPTREPLRLGE